MATGYGQWISGDDWRAVVEATVTNDSNGTTCTVTVTGKLQNVYAISGQANWTGVVSSSASGTSSTSFGNFGQDTTVTIKTNTFTVSRAHAAQSITCKCAVTSPSGSSYGTQTSTATVSVTIPVKASYTVNYDANSGSGAPSSQTKWHGESLTLSTTKPTRSGYTFGNSNGYWHATGGDTGWYAPGGTYTANASATLYAAWTAITYAVKYSANGGSGAPSAQTKTYGTTLKLSTTKPTRSGYTFSGWNTKANGSGTSYASGANYTANAAVTLYAQWTIITYTVSYNANGGSGTMSSSSKDYGESLTVKSNGFSYSGRTFTGWNTKADGSGTSYAAGSTYSANASATLYAQWKLNTYAVTYAANGGSSTPASQTKTHGVALTLRAAITRTSATTNYTVTYNANGGSCSTATKTATRTTTYSFAGWKCSYDSETYNASAIYREDAAATMTAQWTSSTSTGSVTLPTPTRSGYTFNGWYMSGGTKVGNAGASYTPTASITLYAQWTLAYTAPTIKTLKATRCLQDGTADDEGTHCSLTVTWANGTGTVSGVSFSVGTVTGSGTISGTTATAILGTFSTETRYTVTATVTDGTSSVKKTTVLTPAYFTLDFLAGGKGVAIGMAAAAEGFFVNLATRLYKVLRIMSATLNRDGSVSESTYGVGVELRDADEEALATFTPYQYADGETGFRAIAYNEDGSGTQVANIFRVGKKRDGTNTYAMSSPAAFRDALGLGELATQDHAYDDITTHDQVTSVSVPSASWKSIGSVDLAAGVWIVSYNCYFASNATGRRGMLIHTAADATSTANLRQGGVEVMAVSGGVTMLNGCRVLNLTSSATYHLNVMQSSGAALNVTGYIRAVRIM